VIAQGSFFRWVEDGVPCSVDTLVDTAILLPSVCGSHRRSEKSLESRLFEHHLQMLKTDEILDFQDFMKWVISMIRLLWILVILASTGSTSPGESSPRKSSDGLQVSSAAASESSA